MTPIEQRRKAYRKMQSDRYAWANEVDRFSVRAFEVYTKDRTVK